MAVFNVQSFLPIFGLLIIQNLVGPGSPLRMTSSPDTFTAGVHDQLNVTCDVDGPAAYGARDIVVIEIGKQNEKYMAVVNMRDGIHLGPRGRPNMEVKGHIDPSANQSYLTLVIHKPTVDDVGVFTCKVFYMDEEYEMHEERTSINVTVWDLGVTEIIKYLLGKVSNLEKSVKDQGTVISQQEVNLKAQGDILMEQASRLKEQDRELRPAVQTLQEDVSILNATVTHQRRLLEEQDALIKHHNTSLAVCQQHITDTDKQVNTSLKGRVTVIESTYKNDSRPQCAFHLRLGDFDITTLQDYIVVFNDTITNIGNAYDVTTGIFTAPYPGVYVFHLVAMTWINNGQINIDLKKNGQSVADLYAQDKDLSDQSSVTAVLSLRVGDRVWPYVWNTLSGDHVLWAKYSTFSGYLV